MESALLLPWISVVERLLITATVTWLLPRSHPTSTSMGFPLNRLIKKEKKKPQQRYFTKKLYLHHNTNRGICASHPDRPRASVRAASSLLGLGPMEAPPSQPAVRSNFKCAVVWTTRRGDAAQKERPWADGVGTHAEGWVGI